MPPPFRGLRVVPSTWSEDSADVVGDHSDERQFVIEVHAGGTAILRGHVEFHQKGRIQQPKLTIEFLGIARYRWVDFLVYKGEKTFLSMRSTLIDDGESLPTPADRAALVRVPFFFQITPSARGLPLSFDTPNASISYILRARLTWIPFLPDMVETEAGVLVRAPWADALPPPTIYRSEMLLSDSTPAAAVVIRPRALDNLHEGLGPLEREYYRLAALATSRRPADQEQDMVIRETHDAPPPPFISAVDIADTVDAFADSVPSRSPSVIRTLLSRGGLSRLSMSLASTSTGWMWDKQRDRLSMTPEPGSKRMTSGAEIIQRGFSISDPISLSDDDGPVGSPSNDRSVSISDPAYPSPQRSVTRSSTTTRSISSLPRVRIALPRTIIGPTTTFPVFVHAPDRSQQNRRIESITATLRAVLTVSDTSVARHFSRTLASGTLKMSPTDTGGRIDLAIVDDADLVGAWGVPFNAPLFEMRHEVRVSCVFASSHQRVFGARNRAAVSVRTESMVIGNVSIVMVRH